jgi:hypothetical protein
MLKTSSGQSALGGLEKKLTGNVPDDSDVPGPVRRAVRVMLSGGALTALVGVLVVIATIVDPSAFTGSSGKKLSSGELAGSVIYTLVFYLLQAAVWVLLARMNRAGRGWARWVATALAVLSTLYAWSIVNGLRGGETVTVLEVIFIVVTLALWIIGATAAVLLWRGESTAYFKSRAAAR